MDLPDVQPDADLFDLGATSFTAIRIAQRIGDRVGRQVPVDVMIDAPSVDGIVAALTPRDHRSPSGPATGAAADIPPAGGSTPDIRVAFDPAAKQAFKEARVSERALPRHLRRTALGAGPAAETRELFDASSFREFDQEPVPADALLRLLATIAWGELDGRSKRRYPSAGGFYPVQVYVQVRRGRIAGLAGGLYYLHPTERALIFLDSDLEITDATQVQYNRSLVGGAAFGLFLVSTPAAIAPAYGQRLAARYTTLEAGHLCQLLMAAAPTLGLGMCPVGEMDFASVRDHFHLDGPQELLVSLWGGALTGAQLDRRRQLAAAPAARPGDTPAGDRPPHGSGPGGGIPEPVAVVGFAALLPGADTDTGSDSLTAFGRLLESGNVAIGATPQWRGRRCGCGRSGPAPPSAVSSPTSPAARPRSSASPTTRRPPPTRRSGCCWPPPAAASRTPG
jgi:SagB-type dehydrogenase family enzyme